MQNILLADIHRLRTDSDYADKLNSLLNVFDDVKFVLDEVNGVEPYCVESNERYISHDAHIRKVRTPVPAEHAVSLTDMHEAIHAVFSTKCGSLRERLRDEPGRRVENYP